MLARPMRGPMHNQRTDEQTDSPAHHPDTHDRRTNAAMNCVTWYEAFALCAWEGGWLPTEAA